MIDSDTAKCIQYDIRVREANERYRELNLMYFRQWWIYRGIRRSSK